MRPTKNVEAFVVGGSVDSCCNAADSAMNCEESNKQVCSAEQWEESPSGHGVPKSDPSQRRIANKQLPLPPQSEDAAKLNNNVHNKAARGLGLHEFTAHVQLEPTGAKVLPTSHRPL
jgi:hypothetical protein